MALLGPATHVHVSLDWTDRFGERTDCGFVLTLTYIRCRLHGLRQQNEPLLHPGAARVRQQGQLRGRRIIASAQGNYAGFYAEFARAVRGDEPEPVPAAEGIRTVEVLDAARRSAQEKVVIAL